MKSLIKYVVAGALICVLLGHYIHYTMEHAYYKDPVVVISVGQCTSGKGMYTVCVVGTNSGILRINIPAAVGDVIVEECILTRMGGDICRNRWVIYSPELPTRQEVLNGFKS